ncbi:hypothetical protein [Sedimentitalea nanhaiensis]|uniref:50S ribosomal protein L35 n=1 Tax=Sedimentitalea nanhaiensis TaxID=999627 RepID=A0A1I7CGL2_9RHOB|nr:hypothetical protein [Sedimentitalea nanhaiensis]SFT98547.1 hypothetical protein SAMN05216236_11696 [Sedimentitalea nanhaiensis]
MEPDLALTLGVIVGVFSIPSILSAISGRRAPRAPALTILIAGGLILFALSTKPGGYRIDQIPDTVLGVIAGIAS